MTQGGTHWLEHRIPPPLVWAAFATAMYGVTHLMPRLTYLLPWRIAVAVAFAAAGVTAALAGVFAFRRKQTTVNPLDPGAASTVVTVGIYRRTRNPMYLGLLLALTGWAVYLSNAAAALLLPAFVAYMNRFQIGPEERALLAKFGPEFATYMSAVRRWI